MGASALKEVKRMLAKTNFILAWLIGCAVFPTLLPVINTFLEGVFECHTKKLRTKNTKAALVGRL